MRWLAWSSMLVLTLAACASGGPGAADGNPAATGTRIAAASAAVTPSQPPAPSTPPTAPATPGAAPSATATPRLPTAAPPSTPPVPPSPAPPAPAPTGLRATVLSIPALNLSAPVQASRVVPADSYPPTPGCPPSAPGTTTLTVPDHGIATPEDALEGLEGRAWIFGHSRWQNEPGLFFRLQDVNLGDEVLVDGFDRATGVRVSGSRFVVDGIYLADIESGTKLVEDSAPGAGGRPLVILQTSAREDGAGKRWLLDQPKVVAKARNIVAGDLADPCKYLLLFVLARTR